MQIGPGGLTFKSGLNESAVSRWEHKTQKITFSSTEIWLLFFPALSTAWQIRHTCVHGASQLANNITKQGKGGSFLYLTVSFCKGTRIYPPVTIHTPQKKLWKWICMQLVSTSPTAHYKWSRAGGEFSHWDLKPSEL